MRIEQIAKLAGVSTATVSRVLNSSELVRPATAARIRKVIDDVGYIPNQGARTLGSGKSHIFAVIIDDVINPWVAELLHEFENECAAHSYDAIFAGTGHQSNRMIATLQRMVERQVDGIAIFTSEINADAVARLLRHNIPVCGLAYGPAEGIFHVLRIDYNPGIEQAVAHLAKLGHKDIGFISGPLAEFAARVRVDSFRLAMAAAGLRTVPEWVREGNFRMQGGMTATEAILHEAKRPTALICSNDAMALGAIRTLHRAELRVPEDVSVIGIDDLESAQLADPPLTTINIPRRKLAQLAFCGLYDASRKGERQPRESTVTTSLVVRESTAACPKSTTAKD